MSRRRKRSRTHKPVPPLKTDKARGRSLRFLPWLLTAAFVLATTSLLSVLFVWQSRAEKADDEKKLLTQPETWKIPDPVTADMRPKVRRLLRLTRQNVQSQQTSPEAWGQFGTACNALKLYDCAESCYRHARSLAPNDPLFAYLLALILDLRGASGEESIDLYQTAIRLKPDYPPIFFRLGQVWEKQGKLPQARDAYLRAIEMDPRFAMAYRHVGQVFLALGDLPNARKYLERVNTFAPGDGAVLAALSQVYTRMGNSQQARQAAQASRRHDPVYDIADPILDQAFRASGFLRGNSSP